MKRNFNLLIAAVLLVCLNSCKKDNSAKPVTGAQGAGTTIASTYSLTGKWYITKDSVQTLDLKTAIPNLVAPGKFTQNDFVVFNSDSTAAISNTHAFNAFYTDYEASNTDSKLRVNTNIIPNLGFKYHVSFEGYSITAAASQNLPQQVYALDAENLVALKSVGYNIYMPSATTMILEHDLEIPTLQHDYRIKEYIYLNK
ncbi:hypothetical protein [Mucilaginibacter ginsenosidivorax]|uniref:Lipocalin-like domain-containing protein n=1 Tax=Mucilaginibacter ginsenosidivorax TaxID=862126 RepID=A0A5B8W259_9SPHI|nr:hypothetical protein [Mucilaginibacter ginsenosidivorax]QEC77569.1 hypothetical protein FSB76_17055 [Mucilaginibacter ginsenosidivorax]